MSPGVSRTRILPGWKSIWKNPASCSRAVRTPSDDRQPVTDPRSPRLGPVVQVLLYELVQRHRAGDFPGDQIILEEKLALSLLAQGDRHDGGDADRGQHRGSLAFVAALAAAKPLAEHGPVVRHEEVLDEDHSLGQARPGRRSGADPT